LNTNWILLDTGSISDIFFNPKLVTNIRLSSGSLKVHCNAGTKIVKHVATLNNYGTVWFNKDRIANILSMSLVNKKFPVRHDSTAGDQFIVSKHEKDIIFAASSSGLYYHDTTNRAVMLVTTVKEKKEGFTDREFTKAKAARRAMRLVGYTPPRDFKNMVRSNMIKNCTVTPADIDNAHKLFGADIATLRVKTVRRTQDAVMADYVAIPKEIIDLNKEITLAADILFVNGMPFVTSLSRKIKFATMEYVSSRSEPNLIRSLLKIIKLYRARGFDPRIALMDREFECLRIEQLGHGVNLNTTDASEHVPDIERHIRLIKERARVIRSRMPFKIIPGRMIIEMMAHVVLWLNAFPPASGVSATYSPRTIMTGTALDFTKHCQIPFGAYAEVHEDINKTNTIDERTQPAICLGPTANFQGSYTFMSLRTGKRITRKQFTELPMPDSVIKRVKAMALKEKQDKNITFSDQSGNIINDVSDNPDDETVEVAAGANGNDDDNNAGPQIAIEQDSTVEDDNADRTTGVDTDITTTEVVPTEVEQDNTVEDDDADRTTGVNTDSTRDGADRTTGVATEETTEMPNQENETTGVATEEGDATGVSQDSNTAQVEGIDNGMNIGTTGVLPKEPISLDAPRSDDRNSDDKEEDQYDAYHPNTMTPSVQRAPG
jgi:hypothetical protein